MTRDEQEDAILDILKENFDCGNTYGYKVAEKIIEALKAEPCDVVSREAVLKGYIEIERADGMEVYSDKAVPTEYINNLPPVTPKQRWIPVSERLPEKDGEYLLWGKVIEDEENYIFIGDYDSCAEAFGYWQDYYDPSTLGYIDGELNEYASVIAWMPLPEPYKEGVSE